MEACRGVRSSASGRSKDERISLSPTRQQLRDEEAGRQRREASATARDARSSSYAAARGDDGDGFDEELGQFIVSEDCPRCGRQFTTGHAAHLRTCKGTKGAKGAEGAYLPEPGDIVSFCRDCYEERCAALGLEPSDSEGSEDDFW